MALVTSGPGAGPVIAEVEMNGGADPSSTTVRATVVQASTIFYDTPATLGTQRVRVPSSSFFMSASVCAVS
jgi:hypothetical protein